MGRKVSRLFMRYLIRDEADRPAFYTDRIMNFAGDKEDDEFWHRPPTFFTQASDDPARIIFAAGARSNYIFDLKLDCGVLRLYTQKE